MDFNGYEIYVTNQELPHLEATWTNVDTTSENKTYKFKRETNTSKLFTISGYMSMSTWALTVAEAEGLNDSLNTTPSGTFTDGNGNTYSVLVDDWTIEPVAGVNKYSFRMTCRMAST
jgi:hypothetical protein